MAMNLITFSHDSCLHGTHKYIESWAHLNIQVALSSNVLQIENKFNKILNIVLYVSFDVLDGF